jgi:hypothetical protein
VLFMPGPLPKNGVRALSDAERAAAYRARRKAELEAAGMSLSLHRDPRAWRSSQPPSPYGTRAMWSLRTLTEWP